MTSRDLVAQIEKADRICEFSAIQEAVIAERERCAKIAESTFDDAWLSEEFLNELPTGALTGGQAGEKIAARIRSGE